MKFKRRRKKGEKEMKTWKMQLVGLHELSLDFF